MARDAKAVSSHIDNAAILQLLSSVKSQLVVLEEALHDEEMERLLNMAKHCIRKAEHRVETKVEYVDEEVWETMDGRMKIKSGMAAPV